AAGVWHWSRSSSCPPDSLIVQRNGGGPFQPTACTVRYQFDQVDPVGSHGGYPTLCLAHVNPWPDPIGHLVRRDHQRDHATAFADRADHVERVQRELLQDLLAPV